MRADVESILQPDDTKSQWFRLEATIATMRTVDFTLDELNLFIGAFVIPCAKDLRKAVKRARILELKRQIADKRRAE